MAFAWTQLMPLRDADTASNRGVMEAAVAVCPEQGDPFRVADNRIED